MGVGYEGISFMFNNNSSQAIAIDWNRTSITLPNGQTSNVIHEGIKFISAGSPLPPTTVPPGGKLYDSVIPTCNISYSEGWYVQGMGITAGSQFGLYLVLDSDETPPAYNFVFEALEITHTESELFANLTWVALILVIAVAGGLLLTSLLP